MQENPILSLRTFSQELKTGSNKEVVMPEALINDMQNFFYSKTCIRHNDRPTDSKFETQSAEMKTENSDAIVIPIERFVVYFQSAHHTICQ